MSSPAPAPDAIRPTPWWKFGHVWLVIAGPVIVIVAGFVTFAIAARQSDPVIAQDYYRQGMEINQSLQHAQRGMAPALKARNHAATPAGDQPR
ncbi:MAG: FixH family protein [Acidovorax sp.]|uniref:FixH family protein n=1 Tax=Acidovorax sp. TaxID=1872122 RepID=UPI0039E3650B